LVTVIVINAEFVAAVTVGDGVPDRGDAGEMVSGINWTFVPAILRRQLLSE